MRELIDVDVLFIKRLTYGFHHVSFSLINKPHYPPASHIEYFTWSMTMRITILLVISICIALTAGADLFAQDHENVEQVGRIYNQWGNAQDVVVVGDLAYVAAGPSGLQIVDISNPENPEIIGYWDDNPWWDTYGVAVSGDYAYLASDGLRVISVADPEHPEEVGYCDTTNYANDVAVSGDYAYIAEDRSGLRVISVGDPEHPEEEIG